MAVILSLVLVQASSAPQSDDSIQEANTQDIAPPASSDALSAIPLLFLILPIAAVAAFVLEWTNRKGKTFNSP
jgi:hypothetical protein